MKDIKLLISQSLFNGYSYQHRKLLNVHANSAKKCNKISNNYTLNYSKYYLLVEKKEKKI